MTFVPINLPSPATGAPLTIWVPRSYYQGPTNAPAIRARRARQRARPGPTAGSGVDISSGDLPRPARFCCGGFAARLVWTPAAAAVARSRSRGLPVGVAVGVAGEGVEAVLAAEPVALAAVVGED